ncbi:heme oxygenase family protein [Ochrobactrum quorumnocens]|uniref:Heme oxygenase family protein n=1 Tax=Ochrobactrum quorumnocens TaxID=271865 RepID=A0A248UD75_9HYPH|nr:biliverdin-producing heme oxygenase [[Ochrobactrum] quorumnocens]ASV84614.1 heme oxygenase family protein [[Ochrobactrum] quorumnocens]
MTDATVLKQSVALPRSKRLKARTTGTHERLDQSIMASDPFASRERYALFVEVQYQFHRDIDALYDAAALDALLPDLQGRRRFGLVGQDLIDLDFDLPAADGEPSFPAGHDIDLATALGWLYVAEGSNLGAAFLLKEALKLGLSEELGARHLAGAPEGRGLHWRTFTAALDEIELSDAEEERVFAAAEAAFRRVHALVRTIFHDRL